MDSATEFLFGNNVESLSADIPYPASAHLNKPSFYNHPSTIFVKAFSKGQDLTAARSAFGKEWPLVEFWSDKVTPFRKVMDNFTEPLMEDAIAKRNLKLSDKGANAKGDDENGNLLAHLVKHTQGMEFQLPSLQKFILRFWDSLDKNILKDEVISFSRYIYNI